MMHRWRQLAKWFLPLGLFAVLVACGPDKALQKEQARISRDLGEGYLGEGDVTKALVEFLAAEKLNDKDPYLQYDLGLAYVLKQNFQLAIVHFEKAIALKPDYPEAHNALGTVYLRLERWDDAIRHFDKARSNVLYATPHFALNNLGEAYRGKKDYGVAIEFYKKALENNPRYADAHRGLGLIYMDTGDLDASVAALEKAVEYAPEDGPARFDLGRAYSAMYETEKAMAAFKKVIALDPTSPLAERARTEITKLQ